MVKPEFSETHYPGNNAYHLGRMYFYEENVWASSLLSSNQWTFSVPEQIYADVCNKNNLSRQGYSAIGHSAGAQFLHRYLMFWPENEVKKSVISAAGGYNLPDTATAFPYRLKYSPISLTQFARILTSSMHLQVGLEFNNPNSSSLRRDCITDLHGISRLALALYYWGFIQNVCTARGLVNPWTYSEICGINHSFDTALAEAYKTMFHRST